MARHTDDHRLHDFDNTPNAANTASQRGFAIDVSWIEPAAGGALEIRRHDVIHDPPPAETFDLVHARLVLVHLTDRAAALRVMIDALRPGGVSASHTPDQVRGLLRDHDRGGVRVASGDLRHHRRVHHP
jgi:SAM-dependent methyltransferase